MVAILAVAASLALAGCGGGDGSDTGTLVQDIHVVRVIDVHETDFALAPKRIRIERFGYYGLRAINDGEVPHALELEGPGIKGKRTANVEPGDSETMVVYFRRAGTYELYCPVADHEQRGMKATVRVH
jgi:plastocyanin